MHPPKIVLQLLKEKASLKLGRDNNTEIGIYQVWKVKL